MIQQAIADDDPVIFFEPKRRYWSKGEIADDAAAAVPGPGRASGLRALRPCSPTARWSRWRSRPRPIAAGEGHELEVIDLRTLVAARHGDRARVGAPHRPG